MISSGVSCPGPGLSPSNSPIVRKPSLSSATPGDGTQRPFGPGARGTVACLDVMVSHARRTAGTDPSASGPPGKRETAAMTTVAGGADSRHQGGIAPDLLQVQRVEERNPVAARVAADRRERSDGRRFDIADGPFPGGGGRCLGVRVAQCALVAVHDIGEQLAEGFPFPEGAQIQS